MKNYTNKTHLIDNSQENKFRQFKLLQFVFFPLKFYSYNQMNLYIFYSHSPIYIYISWIQVRKNGLDISLLSFLIRMFHIFFFTTSFSFLSFFSRINSSSKEWPWHLSPPGQIFDWHLVFHYTWWLNLLKSIVIRILKNQRP